MVGQDKTGKYSLHLKVQKVRNVIISGEQDSASCSALPYTSNLSLLAHADILLCIWQPAKFYENAILILGGV